MSKPDSSIYLASASPRRRELLQQIGVSYEVVQHGASEKKFDDEEAKPYVHRVATDKACSVIDNINPDDSRPVLAADTIVVCEGRVLGKPSHKDDAIAMLMLLSNKRHQVYSAVCVATHRKRETVISETTVGFGKITEQECLAYWNSGEPVGKAGGYGIQGLGAVFVDYIAGSYSAVVGLPLFETARLLNKFNVAVLFRYAAQQNNNH